MSEPGLSGLVPGMNAHFYRDEAFLLKHESLVAFYEMMHYSGAVMPPVGDSLESAQKVFESNVNEQQLPYPHTVMWWHQLMHQRLWGDNFWGSSNFTWGCFFCLRGQENTVTSAGWAA